MESQGSLHYQQGIDLRHYIAIVWKWLWLIVLGTVVAALIAFVVSSSMRLVYAAKAGVAIVKSRAELTFEPKFVTLPEETALGDAEARRNALVALVANGSIANEVFEAFEGRLRPDIESAGQLLGHINGELVARSDYIEIAAEMHDPALAATIANAWAAAYERLINATYGINVTNDQVKAIEDQMAESKAASEEGEEALVAFLAENRIDELDRRIAEKQAIITNVFNEQVQDRLGKLSDLYATRHKLRQILADARALQAQVDAGGPGAAASNSLALALLKAEAFASSAELPGELQVQVGLEGLDVGSEAQSLDLAALSDTLENRLDELDKEIAALSKELVTDPEYDLLGEIDKLGIEVRQLLAQVEVENAAKQELTRARDLARETYSTLANKVEEVNVASAIIGSEVRFVAPALEPRSEVHSSRRLQNTALAGVAGFMLALGVVFLIGYLEEERQPVEAREQAMAPQTTKQ